MTPENLQRQFRDGRPDNDDHVDEDHKGDRAIELAYDVHVELAYANNTTPEIIRFIYFICLWWKAAIERNGLPALFFGVVAAPSLHLLLFCRRVMQGLPRTSDVWLTSMGWSTNSWLLFSSFQIGLCSFISWAEAEDGIRRKPKTVMVLLHFVYFSLGIMWDAVTIDLGEVRAGLLISLVRAACGVAIGIMLRGVNFHAGKCVLEAGGLLSYYIFRNTLEFVDTWADLFK